MADFTDAWGYKLAVGQRVWYVKTAGRFSDAQAYIVKKISDKSVSIETIKPRYSTGGSGSVINVAKAFYNMTIHPDDVIKKVD